MATLTGCMEETFPTSYVSQEQVVQSPKAASSYAMGMPGILTQLFFVTSDWDWDCGNPALMHIRDIMTGDMPIVYSGYDHFTAYEQNMAMGENYAVVQTVWNTFTQMIQTANLTLGAIDPETEVAINRYYYGAALTYRAMWYLDMAAWYEFLPNDTFSKNRYGNDVTGLTVPIVTENMGEEEARENPRAPHDRMFEFIIDDLTKAESYITAAERPAKTMPDLACVYGMKARAYMWNEDYAKAKEYAEKAIAAHKGSPTTRAQWLDLQTGFNTLATPSWMWGAEYTSDMPAVIQASILTWTGWSCNEFNGYAGAGPRLMIDANLYSKIDDNDFRKLTFVAPTGSALAGQENYVNKAYTNTWPYGPLETYASLKFKPGQGNMENAVPGAVTAYPVMRVEEMYLIQAEAAAHISAAEGKNLLESFMKSYRYDTYTCKASDTQGVVDECFLQKRIELYGEGRILYDYKRLNKPVIRHYNGSNWNSETQFNTETRPAWMNFVITRGEGLNNTAVTEFNNPDTSQCYPVLGE
ncbi:MAG: RagB/SusD family nutrient uptake outer membrane protein [Muribaculaceae bacterium]|nr:RagB/SusD family nutrient uptake outer membrane protein [Muribaculaceae bacterium]